MLSGSVMLLAASICQGTFVLPMTLVRKWRWEQTWLAFSLLGMFVLNWTFGWVSIPHIAHVLQACPLRDLAILAAFGAGWGVGAILFGLGMERLGLSLGYPIIMGLISCLGALIPMAVLFPADLFAAKGLVVIGGTILALAGIILCSTGAARKQTGPDPEHAQTGRDLAVSLPIAVCAGILSCLPNLGMAFGNSLVQSALSYGATMTSAGNAVWMVFFTAGGIVNSAYCAWLILTRTGEKQFAGKETRRNSALAALMALLWIGSFYLYGIASRGIGNWGLVIGWPVFISLSIGTGVIWGLWRGEWKGATKASRRLRNWGLAVLLCAVVTVALSQAV